MKAIIRNTLIMLACSTTAHAAVRPGSEGGSFLLTLFLAFLAMIIWWQLLPAVKLFTDLLKGLVANDQEEAEKHLNS